jgi:hypothetical protein
MRRAKIESARDARSVRRTACWQRLTATALLFALAACPSARPASPAGQPETRTEQWTVFRQDAALESPPVAGSTAPDVDVPLPIPAPTEPGDTVQGGLQTTLLGQLTLAAGARAGLRVVVERETSLLDAEPVGGADVWVALGKGDAAVTVYHGTTDGAGAAEVNFRVPAQAAGDTLLTVHVADRASGATGTHARAASVAEATRVLLTTDKPMYQPGQIIHMRALALSGRDVGARGGLPVTFQLEDAKGNKMYRKSLSTSAQGVAALDFPLASQINKGPWKVSLADADGNVLAEKTVTVEHYVLPKFQVAVTFDRAWYGPGDVVSGTVHADYFFGQPVAGGRVTLAAKTFDVEWNTFSEITGTTDVDGVYGFEVRLPEVLAGSEIEAGSARITFETTVKDRAEHEQTDTSSVVVSRDPINLLVMPESGRLVPGVENLLWIAAARPDGTPVPGTVTLELADGTTSKETDELGIATLRYVPRPDGGNGGIQLQPGSDVTVEVPLTVSFAAESGEIVRRTINVSSAPAADDQVLLRLEQGLVRAGTVTRLQVLSTRRTGSVFLDIVQDHQTVLTRVAELRDGTAELPFAVPPEMAGTLELHAYLLRRDGTFVRDGRVMVVEPADELRIDIEQSQTEYLPGENATIRFAVTDVAGRPKAAALGLIMVDEAVYALQEMQPGLEKIYFLLEQEILKPRYELHFAPGGVSVEEAVKVRDLPERQRKATMILLAAAEPEPTYDLSQVKAQEREAFRVQRLPLIYAALEKLVGLRGADTVRKSDDPGTLADDALAEAVAAGLLADGESRTPSGRQVTAPDLATLEGGLPIIDLAPRSAMWGIVHLYRLLNMWAMLEDAWCDGDQGYEGQGLFCFPDDILTQLTRTQVPGQDDDVMLATSASLRDPWGHRYVVRKVPSDEYGNVPNWQLSRIEISSKGPDGRTGTEDDVSWSALPAGLLPAADGGEYGRYVANAGTWVDYYSAVTAEEQEWETKIGEVYAQREERRERRRWDRMMGAGGGWREAERGAFLAADMAMPMGAPGFAPPPMAVATGAEMPTTPVAQQAGTPAAPARIRRFFPETLLWQPELITDDQGKAELRLDMADSITSWRLTVMASSADGALGSRDHGIVVFQPFFVDIDLPVALTQNDEVSVPVALYNYLDQPQTVSLELLEDSWFGSLSERKLSVRLQPREVTARFFRIKAKAPGMHALTVYATGDRRSDAVRRDIRVEPDGVPVETTFSDNLVGEVSHSFTLPAGTIPGSEYLEVKVYPGAFAQAVENLDSMLQMPGGCFEQTSSSTYPNLLVLDYLKRTETITPEIQMKAEQYVQLGYQRLVTFECQGGGFEWFGNTPAHLVLTAYGLREFSDMAAVYPVDQAILSRTRQFLLGKQQADGSWVVDNGGIAEGAINRQQGSIVNTTAYVAWALASSDYSGEPLDRARRFLAKALDEGVDDPYTLGLLLQVFAADEDKTRRNAIVDKLERIKQADADGRVFWGSVDPSAFGSTGDTATIESTALVALGLIQTGLATQTAQAALDWLVGHKDALGNWSSTQATILTLKALIAAAMSGPRDVNASVQVIVNGAVLETFDITPETSDVLRMVDATSALKAGENTVTVASSIEERKGLMAQVTARSFVPWPAEQAPTAPEPLELSVSYDRSELATGDTVKATVALEYKLEEPAENVIVDLGVPPGFDVNTIDLDDAVDRGKIARYELTGRQIIVYIQRLARGDRLTFDVGFTARFPLRAQTPSSEAYLYYDPAVRTTARPVELTVADGE